MLFIGTIPIVVLLFALESFGFHKWWQTISFWALVGLLFGGASSIIAGVFIGAIYRYVSKPKNPSINTSDQVAEVPIAEVTKTQKPSKFKSVWRFFWELCITLFYMDHCRHSSLFRQRYLGNYSRAPTRQSSFPNAV
jgi:hypothetical protein